MSIINPGGMSGRRWRNAGFIFLLSAVALGTVASVAAADNPKLGKLHPFDPVCDHGRLSNGKGMLVRCLTEAEARQLGVPADEDEGSGGAGGRATTSSRGGAGGKGGASGKGGVPPRTEAGKGEAGAGTEPERPKAEPVKVEPVKAELVSVSADEGKLPKALKLLARARRVLEECVEKHAGLLRDQGEVHVRFLVRSRGIAEGVNVAKRKSVSSKAARCVAEAIDRRQVGQPEAPMVGATLVVRFSKTR